MKNLILIAVLAAFIFTMGCSNSTGSSTISSGSRDYELVSTNQTTYYNNSEEISAPGDEEAFYGQDAQYHKGNSVSYTDNGDGTVSDENTALMWQQVPDAEGFIYDEAVEYCENLVLAGYDDWRMPTLKELFAISDFSSGWPYLDTNYFTLATGEVTKDEQYWSSNRYVGTTVEGGENAAFGVNHVTGHIKAYSANSEGPEGRAEEDGKRPLGGPNGIGETDISRGTTDDPPPPPPGGNPLAKKVRAVRGDVYGVNEFENNGDGTISDDATGLMWMQLDSEDTFDWENALEYAENSEYAGHTDWRVPNVKELQSIVDYDYAPGATDPAKDGAAIDPIFSCTETVNEAGDADFGYYWTSTSANFTSGQPYYYAWYVAFGRAVNSEGQDFHGAGAVRFDTKVEGGPEGEDGERYYNYVRLVRDID